jgi:hypothetical protein
MSERCHWLHTLLASLPLLAYPFPVERLPPNGIYFLYEAGEFWGHGPLQPRLVRCGSARTGNLPGRVADHFAPAPRFTASQRKPSDRSVLRKHIGRALLWRARDSYLPIWNLDFTTPAVRQAHAADRDLAKEQGLEAEITRYLQTAFTLRVLRLDDEVTRLTQLEPRIIATLAHCTACRPSAGWLGLSVPADQAAIARSGIWAIQYTEPGAAELLPADQALLQQADTTTRRWLAAG